MGKIKIVLASGSTIEKPLVTCFKGTNGDYIVFDNEASGPMGLPIVCISKFLGDRVDKIFDQNEWNSVKENLKTIISGTSLPYINVPETLNASDDFFTQLTLPVASFDLIKNVYAPLVAPAPAVPVEVSVDTAPVLETPAGQENVTALEPQVPTSLGTVQPSDLETTVVVSTPVNPVPEVANELNNAPLTPSVPDVNIAQSISIPEVPQIPDVVLNSEIDTNQSPVALDTPVSVAPVGNENDSPVPVVDVSPVVEVPPTVETSPVPEVASNVNSVSTLPDDIKVIKDNFMQSCETMFDALLKKFENK